MQVEYLHQLKEGKHQQCKVQRSDQHQGKLEQDAATTCNYNHHTTNQIRTSTGAVGVPNATINATCVRAHLVLSSYPLNLALLVFSFHQQVQILYLYSCNLHCVVVVACGGGSCIYVVVVVVYIIYINGQDKFFIVIMCLNMTILKLEQMKTCSVILSLILIQSCQKAHACLHATVNNH